MGTDRPRWAVRVGVWLIGLAIVPLTGVCWFAANELQSVRENRALVGEVQTTVDELVLLTELRSHLLDERNWSSAVAGMEQLGIDPEMANRLTGIDVIGELESTERRIDEIVDAVQPAEIGGMLSKVREAPGPDLDAIGRDYLAIEEAVTAIADTSMQFLSDTAGDVGDAASLNRTLRLLEQSAVAREAIARQFSAYWGLLYNPMSGRQEEFEKLVELGDTRDTAIAVIADRAAVDASVRPVLRAMASSPDRTHYETAVRAEIDAVLRGPANGTDNSLSRVLDDLNGVAAVFQAGTALTNLHLDLVAAAGDDVVVASKQLEVRSSERTRAALRSIAAVTIASFAFAAAVAAVIGRPLRKLADSAVRLSAGDTEARAAPAGPTEVRQATAALNEAVDHLNLAERQATAMAQGRFDDPVLSESAPGALGTSLQLAVGALAGSLNEREDFRRRLTHEARYDSLTQVPNRRAVMHHLERSLARTRRTGTVLAVMFIDLDGFKAVNDLQGHPAGDAVLRAVSARLLGAVREGDQVGRLGGDEFLVVAEPVTDAEDALNLAGRLRDCIAEPIVTDAATVSISACIGIALVDATSDLTADEVLRDADLAVYKAKSEGRAHVALCDEALRAELDARADAETAMRIAIDGDELEVHYQPIVDPASGAVLAVEALVRWNRPGVGLVGPDSFIPHAERSDLIVEIDRWVIDQVAAQLCEWEAHPILGSIPIAVNVSARHLGHSDFTEGVLERLYRRGARADRLIVEVTESALLHDLDRVAVRLQALRDRGVRVSIDDFGTGYTSLAHLRTLPVDILKIDRSFTADVGATSLVKLIIDTGHLLGARITAEGIETAEQAASLTMLGSDELQGYLYGHPTSADTLVALIERLGSGSGVAG